MAEKVPGKTYLESFNELVPKLQRQYSPNECKEIVRRLCEYISGHPFTWILAHPSAFLGLEKEKLWKKAEKKLLNATPIQYVTGKAWFFGYPFRVNRNVLIPRGETEEMVDWIIKDYKEKPGIRIVDACTGSGCIGITLARSMDAIVMAFDISEEALDVARENALLLEAKVDFRHIDLMNPMEQEFSKIAVLVANPPYVTESERLKMHPNVVKYEPEGALFVPDRDPLKFYKRLATLGKSWLVNGGRIYVEINERFGKEVVELLQSEGYINLELKKDLNGRDRFVRADNGERTETERGAESGEI